MAESRTSGRGGTPGGASGAAEPSAASRITVDQFTESVFTGVLRAIEARQPKFPGKIIYGIILDPHARGDLDVLGPNTGGTGTGGNR